MNIDLAKLLVDYSNDNLSLREEYSGRGMYGSTTAGVVGSLDDFDEAVKKIMKNGDEDERQLYADEGRFSTDNMGLDYIWY